ncbi:hypothetical protein PICMEDRAFT_120117 [Pichia membranifaciens NRRL Y-2026]|uniref:Cleavage/polyadenylation specificity factor A subunit N-terminal domain-containing protein n=1 Tax=Pichia membranifaciens NRRL Y-2026 TaxID=763406 RepID=A0A1E3NP41_9ASCO|nr:hypothetical protein PICMEDRAFT_120117 [Pichia membranifaciens NRRL Y-2026]ODQ47842.1 hypothetical protein PICMEDRAFT_120117 [Pichia membranifaciens NRRL Y-2026]
MKKLVYIRTGRRIWRVTMSLNQQSESNACYIQTLLHSRLPTHIINNFKINILRNEDGSVNNNRYTKLQKSSSRTLEFRVASEDWKSLLGEKVLEQQAAKLPLSETQIKSKDELDDLDSDVKMTNETYDDTFKPFLDQESKFVTIMTYHSSFSIDNGPCIALPSQIISAGVLRENEKSQEDTLILHLRNSLILIRFAFGKNDQFVPFVVYSSQSISNLGGSKICVNSQKTLLILSFFVRDFFLHTINYDSNGVPSLHHDFNYSFQYSILDQCIVPITESDDAIITISMQGGILCLTSICNLTMPTNHEIMLKNTFPTPLYAVGLAETGGVLLLQENQYTIVSLSFCFTGDESGNYPFNYPETSGGNFKVNSFYIPTRKIITSFSSDGFSEENYKHDQVLISTTRNKSVYLLDVYYDKKRHHFTSTIHRLFKYKHVISLFVFEPVDDSTFRFTFANEMGITESKLVSIVTENETPLLKKVEDIWSQVNPYPMFDYELIASSGVRNTIENPSNDLWAITGCGLNHSLMNFKFGLIADKTQSAQKLYDIDQIYSFQVNHTDLIYVWASGEMRSGLLQLDNSFDNNGKFVSFIGENLVNEPFLCIDRTNQIEQLIVTPTNIFLFDTTLHKLSMHLKLPSECILASASNNIVALLHKDEKDDSIKFVLLKIIGNTEFRPLKMENLEFDPKLVSMMQFVDIGNKCYLIIGDFNGFCFLFEESGVDGFQFVYKEKIRMSSYESSQEQIWSPEYIFVPYKLHQLGSANNFILSSRNGDYSIVKFHISSGNYEMQNLHSVKLGDTGEVEILPTDDPHVAYLLCASLWKIDCRNSLFPEKIVIDGLKEHAIVACTVLPTLKPGQNDKLLVLRGHTLTILSIPSSFSVLTRSKRLETQCMKMNYFSNLDLFVLLPVPDVEDEKNGKLVFVESRTMRVLETGTDFTEIFKKDEIPLCLHTWKVHETSGTYTNLVVGCQTDKGKGVVKVLRLNKDDTKAYAKLVFSYKEDEPVFHIDSLGQNRCLLYSTGKKIIRWLYSADDTRLVERKIVIELQDPIKKFTLKRAENKNCVIKSFLLLAVTTNNKSAYAELDEILCDPVIKEEKTFTEFCSDGLISGDDTLITSNFNKESIIISSIHNELAIDRSTHHIGYIPRLTFINSFPPWVSIKDRCNYEEQNFLTIGLNGQIDLIRFANENNSIYFDLKESSDNQEQPQLLSTYTDQSLSQFSLVDTRTFENASDIKDDVFMSNILV